MYDKLVVICLMWIRDFSGIPGWYPSMLSFTSLLLQFSGSSHL